MDSSLDASGLNGKNKIPGRDILKDENMKITGKSFTPCLKMKSPSDIQSFLTEVEV
jgi:hypothetical protein